MGLGSGSSLAKPGAETALDKDFMFCSSDAGPPGGWRSTDTGLPKSDSLNV
jgi:hypothetical protein